MWVPLNCAGKSTYMSMVPTVACVPLARSLTTIGYSMFLTPTLSMRMSRRSGLFWTSASSVAGFGDRFFSTVVVIGPPRG